MAKNMQKYAWGYAVQKRVILPILLDRVCSMVCIAYFLFTLHTSRVCIEKYVLKSMHCFGGDIVVKQI